LIQEKPSAEYCGHPVFNISYSNTLQLPETMTVDFSKGLTHVEQQLDQYLLPLEKYIEGLKSEAAEDHRQWVVADQKCKAKSQELGAKTIECAKGLDAWRVHHDTCLTVKNVQKLSLCEFGQAYDDKCAAKGAVDNIKAGIVGKGTVWSEPDRENEWTETTKLACVLAKFKTTTALSTSAVEDCTKSDADAAAEFHLNVTRIDMKKATYDELTSGASLTCVETHFTFGGGVLWTVPVNDAGVAGWIPNSTSYTRATGHTYAIDQYNFHCSTPATPNSN